MITTGSSHVFVRRSSRRGRVGDRDQLIRAIGKLARARGVHFAKHMKKGKGSHYVVEYDEKWTTIQSDLNPGRIERCLKQLGLSMRDIR